MLRSALMRTGFMAGLLALLMGTLTLPAAAQAFVTYATAGNERLETLSPDGTLIAATTVGGGDLCAFSVPEGEEVACANLRDLSIMIDPVSINWAPDNSAMVFTEDSTRYMIDSDLWHFDLATATLTNLTDDGVSGRLPLIADEPLSEPFLIDLAPAWSPDGSTIAFSRTILTGEGDSPTLMMLLNVASGDVTELAVFDASAPWVLPYSTAWSPSGHVIFASGSSPDPADERNGVWAFDALSGDFTQVIGTSDAFDGAAPVLSAVSPAGDALIVSYPAIIAGLTAPDRPSGYVLVNLETDEVTEIEPSDTYTGDYAVVVGPTFSPDGASLIFGVRQPSEDAGFVIARHLETGDELVLAELPAGVFPIVADPLTSVQIGGATALVLTDLSTGVLVALPDTMTTAPEIMATPETGTGDPDSAATPEAADAPTTVTIAGNAAVLREGPSRVDAIIRILDPGTELTTISPAFESDNHFWIEVEVSETGETGFVRTDFLEPVG
jgi:hypothetical protein